MKIISQNRKKTSYVIIILFALGLWQLATAGWIQGKAVVAQQLLNHAWQQNLENKHLANKSDKNKIFKPWPWADTWPVAKLSVPQHHIEQVVLAGDAGNSLAFGPGLSLSGAAANASGITMISGHRDTHFTFLKDLKINDEVFLQTPDKTIRYQIKKFEIVDSQTFRLNTESEQNVLVLVTCYPFDAISTRGTARYLVYAMAM